MKIYVDLTYTIAVEVDPDEYEAATDDDLLDACRADPDFALERLHNGPHACCEVDWHIADIDSDVRKYFDRMGDGDGFEVLVRRRSVAP